MTLLLWIHLSQRSKGGDVKICISVGKIAENAVCKSVILTTWHCIISAELAKTLSDCFFGDFAHWVASIGLPR